MTRAIRVVLIDDHTIMREGLKKILNQDRQSRFEVVGEFADGQAFLEFLKHHICDVALLDIQMPKKAGDSILEICTKLYPHVSIVILSMNTNEYMIERTIKSGALGYLAKEADSNEIKNALVTANDKNIFYNEQVTTEKINQFNLGKRSVKLLSNQETIIVRYLVQGLGNDEIAEQLNIAVSTVKKHKEHIMQKTKCKRASQLYQYALEMRIIGY